MQQEYIAQEMLHDVFTTPQVTLSLLPLRVNEADFGVFVRVKALCRSTTPAENAFNYSSERAGDKKDDLVTFVRTYRRARENRPVKYPTSKPLFARRSAKPVSISGMLALGDRGLSVRREYNNTHAPSTQ